MLHKLAGFSKGITEQDYPKVQIPSTIQKKIFLSPKCMQVKPKTALHVCCRILCLWHLSLTPSLTRDSHLKLTNTPKIGSCSNTQTA